LLILVSIIGWVPSSAASADAKPASLLEQIESIIDMPEYKHATWGILVVDGKTGETVYARNPETMLAPASVTKLFSAAAALVAVGPDSRAETCVYQRGVVLKGTLRGDIILVASGDLTFGGRTRDGKTVYKDKDHIYANSGLGASELTDTDPLHALNDLARQIKEAGITQIDGEVLVDDRLFARARGTGSGPDAVSPMMLNDNVIDVLVEPGEKAGDAARVTTRPESAFYQVDALVTTAEKVPVNIQLVPVGVNQFAVRGTVPVGAKPQLRIYPVEEPALFARAAFIEALRRHGVKATAAIARPAAISLPPRDSYEKMPRLAVFTSPPFKDAITVTLKVSHNLYASALPCLVATARGYSTLEAGLREQTKILKDMGVDSRQVSFGGGAGGAQADYATPRATVQLLQGMAKRPEWQAYKDALPILGVDGTLAETVAESSPVRGKACGKTGTLVWVDAANDRLILKSKALAGTMTTRQGTPLFFAMFVNNVPLPTGVTVSREGKALGQLCEILYLAGP
jgi:D-alanyl-D-alanine carboxypeptidase/D-alanyl-D-alanine-endopeptidase (penicillin-binding protein 4)